MLGEGEEVAAWWWQLGMGRKGREAAVTTAPAPLAAWSDRSIHSTQKPALYMSECAVHICHGQVLACADVMALGITTLPTSFPVVVFFFSFRTLVLWLHMLWIWF